MRPRHSGGSDFARRAGLRSAGAVRLVLPARAPAPTPRGLALALDFEPHRLEAAAALLPELAAALLHRLAQGRDLALNREAAGLAHAWIGVGEGGHL